MSDLKVWFGNIGTDVNWYLRDTSAGFTPIDISLLPGPKTSFSTRDAVTTWSAAGSWSNDYLYQGRVIANSIGEVHVFDVVRLWNSVKNVQATSTSAENLYFDGFVHVDVQVGVNSTEGSHLVMNGAKRVNAITGLGDDVVEIAMVTNLGTWGDDFRIATGAGEDYIELRGLDIPGELAAGDTTYLGSATDNRGLHSEGVRQISWIDAGDGDDRVIGYASQDNIIGGRDSGSYELGYKAAPPSGFGYSIGGATGGGHVSTLYRIDLATGATTAVGAVAIAGAAGKSGNNLDVESLSYNPLDQQLYGVVNTPGKLQGLIKVDPTTAKTVFIGGSVAKYASSLQDAAFDLNGSLYLVDQGALIKVDTATGAASVLANKTLSKKIGALAIDPLSGKMFGLAEEGSKTVIYEINKTNGQVLNSFDLKGVQKNSDIEGMSFDSAGALWGVDRISGAIFKIDLATQTATSTGVSLTVSKQTGDGFEALAIRIDADKVLKNIILQGGDKLTGGEGIDSFYYRAGDGVDTITDFVRGEDRIVLSGYSADQVQIKTLEGSSYVLFAGVGPEGLAPSAAIQVYGVTDLSTSDLFFA